MYEADVRRTLDNGMVGEGVKFDRIRRITGYLSSTDNWNNAKQQELKDRVTHINLKEFNNGN